MLGARGAAAYIAFFHGGQELPYMLSCPFTSLCYPFTSLLSCEGAFSDILDSFKALFLGPLHYHVLSLVFCQLTGPSWHPTLPALSAFHAGIPILFQFTQHSNPFSSFRSSSIHSTLYYFLQQLPCCNYENNILNIFLLEENLKT